MYEHASHTKTDLHVLYSSWHFLCPSSLLFPQPGHPCPHFSCHTHLPRLFLSCMEKGRLLMAKDLKAGVKPQPPCFSLFVLSLSGSPKGLQVLLQPDRGRNRAGVGGNRRGRCELVSLFLENECNFHSFPREAESSC